MKFFYVHIIGCQQNDHDGARIRYLLQKLGMIEVAPEKADLIIVVACSVRKTAVDRVFGNVRNWTKNRSRLPTVIATGCVLESDRKKFTKKGILFWDIDKPDDLSEILQLSTQNISKLLEEGKIYSSSVPIMFGCNNFCTYCATAFTRGRERSRAIDDVISDVQDLIKNNHSEILLLGQTIDSYKCPKTGSRLDELFIILNDLPGNFMIAFTSNHPKDMTDEIIEAVATLPKIKKEIHLPLQSGSDKILKAMKRSYTIAQYLKIINRIRAENSKIKITTDVIVGFPGETEKNFQQTVNLFKKVKFDLAYINKYSPRPGTAAFKLGDPIPWSEKQKRWRKLNEIINSKK